MAMQDIRFSEIPQTALRVLTSPSTFFREMPKEGGYVEPLIFMVCMGVVSGLLQSVLSMLGLQISTGVGMALASIVIFPIMIAIMGFIIAAIMFVIWKLTGSQESYETSYRCVAYVSALSPIMTLLSLIPYLGALITIAIACYYYVIASVEVHGIPERKAWMVFGIIAAVLVLMNLSGQYAARKMAIEAERTKKEMEDTRKKVQEQVEAMRKASEEAAKAMQRSAQEAQQQPQPGDQQKSEEAAKEMQKAMEDMQKAMDKQRQSTR